MAKGQPRRFRVYILAPSGKTTRGRYYNKARSAWNRAKALQSKLTKAYTIAVYHVQSRSVYYSCCGLGVNTGVFARESYAKA